MGLLPRGLARPQGRPRPTPHRGRYLFLTDRDERVVEYAAAPGAILPVADPGREDAILADVEAALAEPATATPTPDGWELGPTLTAVYPTAYAWGTANGTPVPCPTAPATARPTAPAGPTATPATP